MSSLPVDDALEWLVQRKHAPSDWEARVSAGRAAMLNAVAELDDEGDRAQFWAVVAPPALPLPAIDAIEGARAVEERFRARGEAGRSIFGTPTHPRLAATDAAVQMLRAGDAYVAEAASLLVELADVTIPSLLTEARAKDAAESTAERSATKATALATQAQRDLETGLAALAIPNAASVTAKLLAASMTATTTDRDRLIAPIWEEALADARAHTATRLTAQLTSSETIESLRVAEALATFLHGSSVLATPALRAAIITASSMDLPDSAGRAALREDLSLLMGVMLAAGACAVDSPSGISGGSIGSIVPPSAVMAAAPPVVASLTWARANELLTHLRSVSDSLADSDSRWALLTHGSCESALALLESTAQRAGVLRSRSVALKQRARQYATDAAQDREAVAAARALAARCLACVRDAVTRHAPDVTLLGPPAHALPST